jgi:hypothetical protein
MSAGLKGVFDMEMMMENGVNQPGSKFNQIKTYGDQIPGFQGEKNLDKGTRYILALHVAIFLLIITVVVGNVGVLLSRRNGKS